MKKDWRKEMAYTSWQIRSYFLIIAGILCVLGGVVGYFNNKEEFYLKLVIVGFIALGVGSFFVFRRR
jgi:hypothetical protein